MSLLRSLLVLSATVAAGCATVESLPKSADEIRADPSRFAYGYWPRYTSAVTLSGRSLEQALAAGRRAMAENDFRIVRDDPATGTLFGEHGMTPFYWNVMAGMYFTQRDGSVEVKIISVGSKDVGFIELQLSPWTDRLASSLTAAATPSARQP